MLCRTSSNQAPSPPACCVCVGDKLVCAYRVQTLTAKLILTKLKDHNLRKFICCSFFSEQNQHFTRWACETTERLLQGGKSHIRFHNHTCFSWFPAPGFTCQLWWTFIWARASASAFKRLINQRIIYLRALFGIVCASTTNQHWRSSYEPSSSIRASASARPSQALSPPPAVHMNIKSQTSRLL